MIFFVVFPAVFCSLFLVASGQYVFLDKTALKTGVDAWIADETAATATYGLINTWDVAGVTDMSMMFHSASSFNGDISGWDVSGVTDMMYMFRSASSFNGDISGWDVSGVTTMYGMFYEASAFNGDLNGWDVSGVTDISWMFFSATVFNQQLCWDLTGKTFNNMLFSGTSGAATIVCPPSSQPSGQPTGHPTTQPSTPPTSQPTRDTSFKKHLKDELDGIAVNVNDNLVYAQSRLIDFMTKFKRAVEPSRSNREEM